MEYKVESLMKDEPKEWNGPHGVVYYHSVMVEGHPKPISVGKKEPNSIKAGDTIYGDIIDTDYLEDKFKPSPPPQGSTSQTSGDSKFLKDLSDLPLRVYSATLPYIDAQGLLKGGVYRAEFLQYVKDVSDELLAMSDNIRGEGKEATNLKKEVKEVFKEPLPLQPEGEDDEDNR